jgi:hypothetical protein
MRASIFTSICLVLTVSVFAQQRVALNSNSTTTIFSGSNPFNDAYLAAVNGDTLYLPGGNIPYPALIDKSLTIFGAGYHPDSSLTTQATTLTGNLNISGNADGLRLEGIHITGILEFNNNQKVDNVTLTRCRMSQVLYTGNRTTPCENNLIKECIINSNMNFANAQFISVSNCFIGGQLSNGYELSVMNSILLFNATFTISIAPTISNANNSYFANNIFTRSTQPTYVVSGSLNTFTKNIFRSTPTFGTNSFIDNFYDVVIEAVLINQSGYTYEYTQNYNLVNPAVYIGTDMTQLGVYGGLYPFKNGGIPMNPHFQFKLIAPQTNSNGELQIEIQVESQNN